MSLDAPDWENQRAFLAVLRHGSLSAAARALDVAQPTVRHRLAALERSVGTALFTRSPSGLVPTEAARQLGPHVEAMAAAADAFARAASAEAGAASGTVRITASEVIGAEVLPPLLASLRRDHPDLAVELHLSDRTEDLHAQKADIAVRMVQPSQAALVVKRVGSIKLGFYATADYLQRHGTPATVADLARFGLIGPDREPQDLRAFRNAGLDADAQTWALRTDSHLAHLPAILAGIGIGVCQVAIARRHPDLQRVLSDYAPGLETWIAMHEDLRHVARVRVTFDHLAAGLRHYVATQD